jgi:Ca2+-binding RTX toxin-like protein
MSKLFLEGLELRRLLSSSGILPVCDLPPADPLPPDVVVVPVDDDVNDDKGDDKKDGKDCENETENEGENQQPPVATDPPVSDPVATDPPVSDPVITTTSVDDNNSGGNGGEDGGEVMSPDDPRIFESNPPSRDGGIDENDPIRWTFRGNSGNNSDPTLRKGNLVVKGTSADDTVTVTNTAGSIVVNVNGAEHTFAANLVRKITVRGEAGNDNLSVNLGSEVTRKPRVELHGGMGNDTLASNIKGNLIGGLGDDSLTGSTDRDELSGGPGNDTIHSGGGRDAIAGGRGNNHIIRGTGNESLPNLSLATDNRGRLTIRGSKAADNFTFTDEGNGNIRVSNGTRSAVFNLNDTSRIRIEGLGGRDTVVSGATLLGNKLFSASSIESGLSSLRNRLR